LQQPWDRIEQHSRHLEHLGLTTVSARDFTYLLLQRQEGAVFEYIVACFQVNNSAASNALLMLTTTGMAVTGHGSEKAVIFLCNMRSLFNEREMTC